MHLMQMACNMQINASDTKAGMSYQFNFYFEDTQLTGSLAHIEMHIKLSTT